MNKDDENLEQPHAGRIVDSITTTGTSAPTVGDEAGEPWDKWEIETLISHIRNPENAKWLTGWSPLQIDLIVDGLKSLQRTLDASPTITEGEAMTDPAPTPRTAAQALAYTLRLDARDSVETDAADELERLDRALSEYRRYDEQTAMLSAAEDRVRGMREALERSRIALDDWLHIYADDMCDPEKVAESVARISEAGATLAYIASVQKQNRAALAQSAERAEKGRSS